MKKGNFLNYNTLKGRIIFAIFFSIVILISITIIDTKTLHNLNLNIRDSVVGKYLDLMSIFVFVNGMLFMLYSYMGVYDAITFITSTKVYSSKIFFVLMVVLGILQAFAGIDTLMRLFQMNGLLVSRNPNTYTGIYLFTPAIRCVVISLVMYAVRVICDIFMRRKHKDMMDQNEDLRARKKRMEDFLNNEKY